MSNARLFGLTGGIACGKSTVAQILEELGAYVIDADQVSRDVVQLGTDGYDKLLSRFGEEILNSDGTIDRAKLGKKVFADQDARHQLEAILHPLIARESAKRIALARASNVKVIVYEATLLIESGRADSFRPLIVVWSSSEQQRARLKLRNALSDEAIKQRLESQLPIERKKSFGDILLENNGSLDLLRKKTGLLWQKMNEN